MTRVAFDSNILIYIAGGGRSQADREKLKQAQGMYLTLLRNDEATLIAPVQALGEAVGVLARKYDREPAATLAALAQWEIGFQVVPTTLDTLRIALPLSAKHQLQHWDAVIVCAAVEANCSILLSEDMQHGFVWRGLTIINPFAADPHPLLASLL